jgi:hypothetical protein
MTVNPDLEIARQTHVRLYCSLSSKAATTVSSFRAAEEIMSQQNSAAA